VGGALLDTLALARHYATAVEGGDPNVRGAVYEGKAKLVTPRPDGTVTIFYKDDATAFNGERHEQFEGKGALNSQVTELLFYYLAGRGITTHHLGRLDERTLAARQVEIIPIEAVVRFKVAGSLEKRTGLPYLTAFETPIVEFYYKRDDLGDPMINDDHVDRLGLATATEAATIRDEARRTAVALRDLFAGAGIDLVDLKFEYGRTADGEVILADEISPDTCRFRDMETGEILDKDLFRFDQGDLLSGYRKLLDRLGAALSSMPDGHASS
jgi:phosphoribosylaminoimidazole-succinocarboxamide synthase